MQPFSIISTTCFQERCNLLLGGMQPVSRTGEPCWDHHLEVDWGLDAPWFTDPDPRGQVMIHWLPSSVLLCLWSVTFISEWIKCHLHNEGSPILSVSHFGCVCWQPVISWRYLPLVLVSTSCSVCLQLSLPVSFL